MGRAIKALKKELQAVIDGLVADGLARKDHHGDVTFNDTSWSDYHGSTYTRSNERILCEQFGDIGVHSTGLAYSGSVATLSADWFKTLDWPNLFYGEFITERVEALAETIRGLQDYPIIDDDDLSKLEMEIVDASWDQWLGCDVQGDILREMRRALRIGLPEGVWPDDIDAWEMRSEEALDAAEGDLREKFWETLREVDDSGEWHVFEGADSFYVPRQDEVCKVIAREILEATRIP